MLLQVKLVGVSIRGLPALNTILTVRFPIVNLRFSFQPAAIAYPTSPQEVSELIKLGVANKLQVVPRGGGVSFAVSSSVIIS